MIDLRNINKDIIFEPDNHTYHYLGKELRSVTTLLSFYKQPFDETGIIAYKCAQREGVTKSEIQTKWQKISKDACDYGKNIHGQIEHYLKTNNIQDTPEKDIIQDFSALKFKGKIFSEIGLHSARYGLAGTCDIATLNKNTIQIYDIKTNRRFDVKSKYGKKLLYPLDHLYETHLVVYSLQILIYGEMVKEHGFKFKPGQILWVNPESRKIEKFDVLDLNIEVNKLLKHYYAMQNW